MTTDKQIDKLQEALELHIKEFEMHVEAENDRWLHLINLQEQNAKSITALAESTKDLVEAWKAADGAIKVGAAFGRFVKWLTGIAIVGIGVSWLIEKVS